MIKLLPALATLALAPLAIASLAPKAIAAPANWVLVGKSDNGNMYVNAASIVKNSDRRYASVWYTAKMVLFSPSPEGTKTLLYLYSANCNAQLQRQRAVVAIDETGVEVDRVEDGDAAPLLPVRPNTTGGAALKFACR
jgi:hypothetical protein